MIEKLAGFPSDVLAFACRGRVTRRDYETVLIPAAQAAFEAHDRVRLYYEIGPDFETIETGALLEDLKVGMEHLTSWDRVALVSDVDWIRNTVRLFGFLLPGRLKVFHLGEASEARHWISATN
ncbi:STAS/SEC14 domain-containing protein [Phenylobacterium montanum]|uniref:STAS/SEC14 domain-containing protein n=1 Tax=Phenylobacterium montanum TaxID=2823693 RepID=A0A975G2V2_9CAUL|nr:STAS/SEC14 domain-containing protein [Caulobacter sp. S6]QUD89543.1 STAS/SEC14 domain-containing protein [Caulobacter sp. S6]